VKRARDVRRAGRGPQVTLLGGGPGTLERAGGERHSEAARGMAADHHGLVEAALEPARAMQRHRHDRLGQRRRVGAPLASDQHAEQPAAGRVAVKFERAHAMIDRVVVAIGRDEQ